MRTDLIALAAFTLSGCLNWQETYNSAARNDCRRSINADERRACLDRVEENATDRRAAQRGG